MTREEAIRCLSVYSSTNGSGLCTNKQHYEAKQMAIEVLEQEPVLDKIRAEIELMPSELTADGRRMIRRESVFRIIDKYKTGSEDKR